MNVPWCVVNFEHLRSIYRSHNVFEICFDGMDFAYAESGRKKPSKQNDGRIFHYMCVQSSNKFINLHSK